MVKHAKKMNDNYRVVIENVRPSVGGGEFPAKKVEGQGVEVLADIFADGHDRISANLLYRYEKDKNFKACGLQEDVNDLWEGYFVVDKTGKYYFTVEAWVDHFLTWQEDLEKKFAAGLDVGVELEIGAELISKKLVLAEKHSKADYNELQCWFEMIEKAEQIDDELIERCQEAKLTALMRKYPDPKRVVRYERELEIIVERKKALFSSWYELFPRSCGKGTEHGTFKDVKKVLKDVSELGFDVLYLPPIHPIGWTHRKGRNNSVRCGKDDPGCPWAIGSPEGGHKSIHPELGSMEDFEKLVEKAGENGIEIALDIAFQCSPDHPYVKEHPEWFMWRPDGTIQYAENPPKKYEDIVPINFESDDWKNLWDELKSVFEFWIDKGVKIFRVDNPHTKAFGFWKWVLGEINSKHPEVIFLSEAFTRPKKMKRLAKTGFTQSYTYFTWRNTKHEIEEYIRELTETESREFFRPNFWPNTPDILPHFLQYGGKPGFIIRLLLAGTLSSNYGIYGPAFELCQAKPFGEKEEYLDSEKYEIKDWDRQAKGNIRHVVKRINEIRRANPALQETNNITLCQAQNDSIICYVKKTRDLSNIIVTVVNMDPVNTQSAMVNLPLKELGIEEDQPFLMHDLFGQGRYLWQGWWNYVELNPHVLGGHVFVLHSRMGKESDFDGFV